MGINEFLRCGILPWKGENVEMDKETQGLAGLNGD